MEREIEWPITDVVTENLIGSLTQVVSLDTSSALSFPLVKFFSRLKQYHF
jgi:hypothetical protein